MFCKSILSTSLIPLFFPFFLDAYSTTTARSFAGRFQEHREVQLHQNEKNISDIQKGANNIFQSSQNITQELDDVDDTYSKALNNPLILRKIFKALRYQDLISSSRVCQAWEDTAIPLSKTLLATTQIVSLHSPSLDGSPFSSPILQGYKCRVDSGTENQKYQWRPRLTMLFQSFSNRLNGNGFTELILPIIRNCRTFAASPFCPAVSKFEGEKDAKLFIIETIYGFVFPEGLLDQAGIRVDVISPHLELFRNDSELFGGTAEENKKSFEQLFGWKSEVPIKIAIVMSRRSQGDIIGETYKRAKEVTRWLKSLPEGQNMPIVITLNYIDYNPQGYQAKSDGPVSVILFGGDAIHASAYIRYNLDDNETNYHNDFLHWKETDYDKMPKVTQRIGFRFGKGRVESMPPPLL